MSKLIANEWLGEVVSAASAAPSIHNSQPWQFSMDGDVLKLHGAGDRALCVSDPAARALYISCGAALFNVRLSLRMHGLNPEIRMLPQPDHPFDVLALIRALPGTPPTAAETELFEAIPARHTNRQPFSDRYIPHAVWERLRDAAWREHTVLHIPNIAQAADLLQIAANAGRTLARSGAHQAELQQWIGNGREDGIPLDAMPGRPGQLPAPVRVDDFRTAAPVAPLEETTYEDFPQLAVLTTHADEREDWLVAGQALQRVLLIATVSGLSASFLYQPMELRDMGEDGEDDALQWPGPPNPQMILRLGYATTAAVVAPRRAPDSLVQAAPGRHVA